MRKMRPITAGLIGLAALTVAPFPTIAGNDAADEAPITRQATTELQASASVPLPDDGTRVPLFLAVTINGEPTGLVAEFSAALSGTGMEASRSELREIGLKPPRGLGKQVALDAIEGVSYRYDAAGQAVYITAPPSALRPDVISAAQAPGFEPAERSFGAVLNYSLVAQKGIGGGLGNAGALSASLDGWIYAPFGRLGSTAFLDRPLNGGPGRKLRLESALRVDMPGKALALTVGDFTTSGPAWARPIRMGGVSFRRDFSLRSDLVTDQRLSYSGAAAVPSSVDVFIENNRVFSTPVGAGPFALEDIPVSGAGDAQIVVRTLDGEVKRENVSFFASSRLLKKGMADYAISMGRAREGFAIASNDYGNRDIVTGTFRYGLSRRVTLEAHVEHGGDLTLWGGGITAVPLALGEITLAGAQSRYQGRDGQFGQIALRTRIGRLDLSATSSRTSADFADLAYVTGLDYLGGAVTGSGSLLEVPLAQDVFSLAAPLGGDNRKLGLSYVRARRANSSDELAAVSWGTSLGGGRGSLSMNGAWNFGTQDLRVSVGVSMRLGKRTYAQASTYTDGRGRVTQDISVSRAMGEGQQAWGYQVQAGRKAGRTPVRLKGEYRARYGEWTGEVQSDGRGSYLRAQLDGAVALAGGGPAFGGPIDDGFAVVDLGVSDIPVYVDNRPVARTGSNGRVLVGGLNSYRPNRVSVNVRDLPEGATLGVSAAEVVPSRGGGQRLSFGGSASGGVLVTLRDARGAFLPVGTRVTLGRGGEAYVGYDGQTWIEAPGARTELRAALPGGSCTARFAYRPSGAAQDAIEATCR